MTSITKHNRDAKSLKSAYSGTKRLTSQLDKKPMESGGKGSVALLKNWKQSGCVFKDIEPPISRSILRKGNIFGTKAQRAILERYITPRSKIRKERVHPKVQLSILILTSVAPIPQILKQI